MSSLMRIHLLSNKSSNLLRHLSTGSLTASSDILVNGGGIVGLTLLASLAKSPRFKEKRIILLEQQPEPAKDVEPIVQSERILSNRVSSLTTSSKAFFEEIGIWNNLEKYVKKADRMHVWSDSFSKGITFDPSESHRQKCLQDAPQDDAVCYFVENHILQNALRSVIPSDWIRFSCQATNIQEENGSLSVTFDGKGTTESVATSLLIGCDGFKSFVRGKSNLEYREFDWHESAIVATLEMDAKSEEDENSIAYQRFLPEDGSVIALLPLTQVHSSLVLSTSKQRVNHLLNLEEEQFIEQLNSLLFRPSKVGSTAPAPISALVSSLDSIANSISNFISSSSQAYSSTISGDVPQVRSLVPGSRASFPLFFGTTLPYMTGRLKGGKLHRIALIGDSCHRIPPLAGQGLNLGIGDAIELSSLLDQSLSRGEHLFSNQPESQELIGQLLSDFERKRMVKLIPILSSVATMQKVFQFTPSNLVSLFNQLPQLKKLAVRFANSR